MEVEFRESELLSFLTNYQRMKKILEEKSQDAELAGRLGQALLVENKNLRDQMKFLEENLHEKNVEYESMIATLKEEGEKLKCHTSEISAELQNALEKLFQAERNSEKISQFLRLEKEKRKILVEVFATYFFIYRIGTGTNKRTIKLCGKRE